MKKHLVPILIALLACVAGVVCFLAVSKKAFDPVGTWEFSAIIRDDKEFSAGDDIKYDIGLETFTLRADGTGSWVTEIINPGKTAYTMEFTYTKSGNGLTFVNLDHSSTIELVYDSRRDALSRESSYETGIYTRVDEAAASDPTPDQLSGVWKTDGVNFGEDQILFGSLILDKNGSATLDLSTGGGSALQKEYTFVLDKKYVCLSTDEGSVYGLYDSKIDTIYLPFKHTRSLPFTRTQDPIPVALASPAPAAQPLPGVWELAWMESTETDEYWEEKQKEGFSSGEPYIATFPEEYELFYSGEKSYTMILYESVDWGDLIIQNGGSTAFVTVGCDIDKQVIRQLWFELNLPYHLDGDQLILEGDGFRVGFKRFDFIPSVTPIQDSDDPNETISQSE